MLELYHHGSSVCVCKVRLVLEHKGLEWIGHYVDIHKSEQFDPEYMKLNPKAVVPTLVHDGKVVCESTVIMEYLNDIHPEQSLIPEDPYLRTKMRIWTKGVDENVHPACAVVTFSSVLRYRVMRKSDEELEEFLNAMPEPLKRERKRAAVLKGYDAPESQEGLLIHRNYLDKMEKTLQEGDWLIGEQYSLADVAMTPYVNRLDMIKLYELFMKDRPHVHAWFQRIKSMPNFEPAINKWMPQDLTDDFSNFGQQSVSDAKRVLERI